MNLNQLRYFLVLAQLQHYTKASEQLNISQPSLSKAISNLEKELNVLLFEKDGRNIRLTKQGELYQKHIQEAVDKIDYAKDSLTKQELQKIQIGYVSSLAVDFIPNLINQFKERRPDSFFSLDVGISSELLNGLRKKTYDLVFCTAMVQDTSITYVPVLQQQLMVACAKDHPFSTKSSLTLKDLINQNFIHHSKETGMYQVVQAILQEENTPITIVAEANEDRILLGLVASGLGIGIVTMSKNIEQEDVTLIPLVDIKTNRFISMAYRNTSPLPKIVRDFKQFILDSYPV